MNATQTEPQMAALDLRLIGLWRGLSEGQKAQVLPDLLQTLSRDGRST